MLRSLHKWAVQEGLDLGRLLTQRKENEAPMMMARFEMSTQPLFLSIEEAEHISMLRKISPKKRKNIKDRTKVAFVEECGREA